MLLPWLLPDGSGWVTTGLPSGCKGATTLLPIWSPLLASYCGRVVNNMSRRSRDPRHTSACDGCWSSGQGYQGALIGGVNDDQRKQEKESTLLVLEIIYRKRELVL